MLRLSAPPHGVGPLPMTALYTHLSLGRKDSPGELFPINQSYPYFLTETTLSLQPKSPRLSFSLRG